MLRFRDYALIAHLRGLAQAKSLSEIKSYITDITPDELAVIKQWNDLSKTIKDDYPEYSTSELAVYLSSKTGYSCPLNPISTVLSGVNGKSYLVALYQIKGYQVTHPKPVFTAEQAYLISQQKGLFIVNAGAGTGKTTTAVERAFNLKSEGVILISYSNEAVKEIQRKIKEYPNHRGKIGFKEFVKPSGELYQVVITTVDSLAWHITNKSIEGITTHDNTIKDAVSAISFGQSPSYSHIIVDEAQDIDELRGEVIKALYATGKYASMMIFGDPKQRISRAGLWYSDLWINKSYSWEVMKVKRSPAKSKPISLNDALASLLADSEPEEEDQPEQLEIEKSLIVIEAKAIGLTTSYRFQSQQLLNLHNHLSRSRPEIDVQLKSAQPLPVGQNIRCYNVGDRKIENGMIDFVNMIKLNYLDSGKYLQSDICVIIPSVANNNGTSKRAQRLCAIMKDCGINCYTRREGSFVPNGVLVTTIQSVKGKQFKIVILYCMSEFPTFMPQIPIDIADSLIYVAHTRAIEELIYIGNTVFGPPRAVDPNAIEMIGCKLSDGSVLEIQAKVIPVTEMIKCHGWTKLIGINNYSVIPVETTKLLSIPEFTIGDVRLKGVMVGLIIQTLTIGKHLDLFEKVLSNRLIMLRPDQYNKLVREGTIIGGVSIQNDNIIIKSDPVNGIRPEELSNLLTVLAKPITELDWIDWIQLTRFVDYTSGDHMNSRYDFKQVPSTKFPYPEFKAIADQLTQKFGSSIAEVPIKFSWTTGCCDLLFEQAIVELKCVNKITTSHRQQVQIYNSCLDKFRVSYVYNLLDGNFEKVESAQDPLLWKYIIDCYGTIRNHADMVTSRKNIRIRKGAKVPLNGQKLFAADTEFHNGQVFDFALVNLSDIYSSICTPLQSFDPFAVEWISQHHSFWKPSDLVTLFAHAPNDLTNSFRQLGRVDQSKVLYYKAPEDIKIPSLYGMQGLELSSILSKLGKENGTSLEPVMSVKLGEIYDLLVTPLQYERHLHQHSALTDALILYELYHLGYLL